MGQRPRALLLTPVRPEISGGGLAQRAHQWVHCLAALYDVDVLVVHSCASTTEKAAHAASAASWRELTPTPTRATYWTQAVKVVGATLTARRRFAFVGWGREWGFLTPDARAQLSAWYTDTRWCRLVAFRLRVFDYAEHFASSGNVSAQDVVLDFDDVESETRRSVARGLARMQRWREAVLTQLDALYASRVERRAVETFPNVTVCSSADQAWVEDRLPAARAEVFPNRFHQLPQTVAPGDPRRILFIGTLGYSPNEEAVRFLVERVLDSVRGNDVRWKVAVAGFGARPALRRLLERQPGVEFLGPIADVADAYRKSGIVAAPLFAGGGTKVKVVEALAFGRPLIATAHAVRGLSLQPAKDFWPAETISEWVDACRRLADDPKLAARLAASGREAVGLQYVYGPKVRDCAG